MWVKWHTVERLLFLESWDITSANWDGWSYESIILRMIGLTIIWAPPLIFSTIEKNDINLPNKIKGYLYKLNAYNEFSTFNRKETHILYVTQCFDASLLSFPVAERTMVWVNKCWITWKNKQDCIWTKCWK